MVLYLFHLILRRMQEMLNVVPPKKHVQLLLLFLQSVHFLGPTNISQGLNMLADIISSCSECVRRSIFTALQLALAADFDERVKEECIDWLLRLLEKYQFNIAELALEAERLQNSKRQREAPSLLEALHLSVVPSLALNL